MNVAYLINAYPRPSQSFIRREMAALESQGVRIQRFAIRAGEAALDDTDRAEAQRTRYVLSAGGLGLLWAVVHTLLTRPLALLRGLKLALRVGRRSDRGILYHLIYLAEACVLRRWFAEGEIQHVHSHFGTNSTAVAMLCRELGGPGYSFTAHGPEEFDKPEALALGEKINRASFVIAVCEFGRSQLYRWCRHEQWHKVKVVHCGVDESFLKAPSRAVPEAPRLLSVGRLSEQKGQLLLIEAAAILKSRGIEFKLVLVGDGELRSQIEELIQKHSLSEKVTLAGWRSNRAICDLMQDARALVMPSFAEGLPVVLMESLALKRPVLSTYIAGIPELVANEGCGFLVPAGDVVALADAMAAVLAASPEKLEQMGEMGSLRVRQQHDASIEATKMVVLFRQAIAKQPNTVATVKEFGNVQMPAASGPASN
jgi:glycosyltransferase involved in cell wall biosynthesis